MCIHILNCFVSLQCYDVSKDLLHAFDDRKDPEKACEDVGLCSAVAFGKINFLRMLLNHCLQWLEKYLNLEGFLEKPYKI